MGCKEVVDNLIDRAESLENQEGEIVARENAAKAHQLYREAARIAKEAELDRTPSIIARLQTRESRHEMRQQESDSARTELHEHLVSCQRAVRDAVTALKQGNLNEATNKYETALERAVDAYQLVSVTDFGTTREIEQHNRTRLYQNCQTLANQLDEIEQEGLAVDPLTTAHIQVVTEHFKPEKIPDSVDTVETLHNESEFEDQREETDVIWKDTADEDGKQEPTADDGSILDEMISSFDWNVEH